MDSARGKVDATQPLYIHLEQCDTVGATPRSATNCAIARCAKRIFGFVEFIVYAYIAYGRMEGEDHYTRWQSTKNIRTVIKQFDINKTTTKKRIPKDGIDLTFLPPRPALQLSYLRSTKRKPSVGVRPYKRHAGFSLSKVRWGTTNKT